MVQWFSETPLEAAKHRFKSCCFHLQAVSFQSSSGSFLNPISNLKETRFHFPNMLGHSKHRHSHCSEELATWKPFRYKMF